MISVSSPLKAKNIIVLTGPSGTGKTTLLKKLLETYPNKFYTSISYTTRDKRDNEKNGIDYFFVEENKFKKMIDEKKFIEFAKYNGKYYGTAFDQLPDKKSPKTCILDIDLQGVKSMKALKINTLYILLSVNNVEVLEERLRKRGSETDKNIASRLEISKMQIKEYKNVKFDFKIKVDKMSIEQTYEAVEQILHEEKYY